jgi:hypothetical protein
MRGIAFFTCLLTAYAATPALAPPDASRQEATISSIKEYAAGHLNRDTKLACSQAATGNTHTMTVEFTATPHRGIESGADTAAMIETVFSASSAAEFHFDHYGTIGGKRLAAYAYSFVSNGKTHAGSVYANEDTGEIVRMTFRGEASAHLFCSSSSR